MEQFNIGRALGVSKVQFENQYRYIFSFDQTKVLVTKNEWDKICYQLLFELRSHLDMVFQNFSQSQLALQLEPLERAESSFEERISLLEDFFSPFREKENSSLSYYDVLDGEVVKLPEMKTITEKEQEIEKDF